jgi:segregation and condensation protein B
MDQTLVTRIVEAALLAASQPLSLPQLQGLFPLDAPAPEGSVERALESLQADCAGRGVEVVELASGWRYQVQADVHPWVARLWTERQAKYTRATLETLALIAYRQPITRGEIEQVRGVQVNSNIIKALEEREWIRVVGHRDVPGRPELLGTTRAFLDYFGLKRLDQLPPLSELKDFAELEPQLRFEGDPMPLGDIGADGSMPASGQVAPSESAPGADSGADPDADGALDARKADEVDARDDGADAVDDSHERDDAAARDDQPGDIHARVGDAGGTDDTHDRDDAAARDDQPGDADARDGDPLPGTPPPSSHEPITALAEDGDSTGARHD